jgi:hypothetical protein
MDLHLAEEFFESAAASLAIGRLTQLRLLARFPGLAAYLSLIAVSHFIGGILPPQSLQYFWFYIGLIPVECLLGIFAVRELIALIFSNYPGIRTVGRWALYGGIAFSVSTSLLLTKVFWYSGAHPRSKWGVFYFEAAQRSIVFSLVLAIAAVLFVLSRYPLHLGRNTYVSCGFFSIMFLVEAAQLLIDSTTRVLYNHAVDAAGTLFISACLLSWASLLQPQAAPVKQAAFTTAQEDQLLQQLDSLNRLMTRAARR